MWMVLIALVVSRSSERQSAIRISRERRVESTNRRHQSSRTATASRGALPVEIFREDTRLRVAVLPALTHAY